MCVDIVGCSDIFELNHSINSKWQFLDRATFACSERYVRLSFAETLHIVQWHSLWNTDIFPLSLLTHLELHKNVSTRDLCY